MTLKIKICGLSDEAMIDVAIEAGADMIGLVLFPRSPRFVSLERARDLADHARGRVEIVTLSVDLGIGELAMVAEALKPDWLQLHGQETPPDLALIKQKTGLPIIKALAVGSAEDLASIYADSADRLLLDARPPENATRPGGNGLPFDWDLLDGYRSRLPYMLSGGLDPANVGEAIRQTGAMGFDVSSGVELSPGRKDAGLIRAFIAAVRNTEKDVTACMTEKAAP